MKTLKAPVIFLLIVSIISACTSKESPQQEEVSLIKQELTIIDSLLRSADYNTAMAQQLEASYYKGIGQAAPPFLAPGDDTATITRSQKEEKIVTNIAGFYALECGIGWLCAQTNTTPVYWLKQIVDKSIDSTSVNLINRFANATWKAGQPFRDIKRIERSTFTIFNFLPADEVKKDLDMYTTAAAKLLPELKGIDTANTEAQMQKIKQLMQDENFTIAMADSLQAGYNIRQRQPVTPFLTAEDDTAKVLRTIKAEKVATNVAGFYALECGLNYFAAKGMLPSAVLQSIIDSTINKNDKMLLHRFANATWKAGQPFRGLNRIKRDNFVPFYFLSQEEIDKDWVQVKGAAEKLRKDLKAAE